VSAPFCPEAREGDTPLITPFVFGYAGRRADDGMSRDLGVEGRFGGRGPDFLHGFRAEALVAENFNVVLIVEQRLRDFGRWSDASRSRHGATGPLAFLPLCHSAVASVFPSSSPAT
jgi:hypothetical protein